MNDDEIAKEIYRVQRERRDDIEKSTISLGHQEKRLSDAAHTELCRYILIGTFSYQSFCLLNFTKTGSPNFLEGVIFCGALTIVISIFGMFLTSQAHYQQAEHYFHEALFRFKQMENDATAITAHKASEACWKLAEGYRKYSMICFYISLILFFFMFLLSVPIIDKHLREKLVSPRQSIELKIG